MNELIVPAVVLAVLASALLILLVVLLGRRSLLSRGMATFDCSLRRRVDEGGWVLGVARYADDRLDWFRLLGVSLRPARSLPRNRLTILGRRRPDPTETPLSADWVLVRCQYDSTTIELGMSELAYNGLSTWLESAPPGEHSVLN